MALPSSTNDERAYPQQPELIIGLVAAVGTPLDYFKPILTQSLESRSIESETKKLSRYASEALAKDEPINSYSRYKRIDRLMTLGNLAREKSGRDDVLALFAVSAIAEARPPKEPRHFESKAFILDQLKRPEEVFRLRRIYRENFVLIGLYCPKDKRKKHLALNGVRDDEVDRLITRDENEALEHGQRLSSTYHLADIFIEVSGDTDSNDEETRISDSLDRFWSLLFGDKVLTPTRDEYSMFLAHAASMRSSSLSRQVGAAILSEQTELLSLGANDVPCWPGGLYWGDEEDDGGIVRDKRDHLVGYDESDRMKREIVKEILPRLNENWKGLTQHEQDAEVAKALSKLSGARISSLTEFARAVHAEMDALLTASRLGISVQSALLFSTTFPCHNCAKHIVAAGIQNVVFMEPYPKSRVREMYDDSIYVEGESDSLKNVKVVFRPFVGVAPRSYSRLFGRYNFEGRQLEFKDKATGELKIEDRALRIPFSPLSYVNREGLAAKDLKDLKGKFNEDTSL